MIFKCGGVFLSQNPAFKLNLTLKPKKINKIEAIHVDLLVPPPQHPSPPRTSEGKFMEVQGGGGVL